MTRVTPLSERGAGIRARIVFWFAGRALARLAGRPEDPDRMLEPLRLYAHLPAPGPGRHRSGDARDDRARERRS